MSLFKGLEQIVRCNYPLAGLTWYGIGGPADYLVQPQDVGQLQEVVKRCQDAGVRIYVLGAGSNLLIPDEGVRGVVIKLDGPGFTQMRFDGEQVYAGAGVGLGALVLECVKRGLSGLEGLTGIPGSVGGAVKMNAGGRFGNIGTVIESVTLMDINGQVFQKAKPELSFDYRSSNIASKFILGATMRLASAEPDQVLRSVQEVWIYKKNHQPLDARSCGCAFKNPPGQSAGALIERAGLKGFKVGKAMVSDKHANFIVVEPGCSSKDVLRLMEIIVDRVKGDFGIELQREIEVW
ncbi:MAG: UDP-N-acetylmuramate dehydrogenase [Sedimentisphaerales bacterium]|jgi:UDP-N-acetylmuramate dehydrogenase|nr:UDP-N-acetylmuramate dehydrogenase [Sedimentisphaerales bacterium]